MTSLVSPQVRQDQFWPLYEQSDLPEAFNKSLHEVVPAFSPKTFSPQETYEKAWGIFMGTVLNGKSYFFFHLTEGYSTDAAYRQDSDMGNYPFLLHGRSLSIKTEDMDLIRNRFSDRHRGNLPSQIAFAITLKIPGEVHQLQPPLSDLLRGAVNELFTDNYLIVPMTTSNGGTLRFKASYFPFEIWAQQTRPGVSSISYDEERDTVSIARIMNIFTTVRWPQPLIKERVQQLEAEADSLQRENHLEKNPDSYGEATFQLSLTHIQAVGSDFYRQVNGWPAEFKLGRLVRFQNDMHPLEN